MGALTGLSVLSTNRFLTNLSTPGKVLGQQSQGQMLATAVLPASYDTGGSILDLSGYFADIPDAVFILGAAGITFQYVAGASAALGKVKAFSSVGSHTHNVPVGPGGAAAAGTHAVQVAADSGATTFNKESAGAATIPTAAAIVEGGSEVASTTDLHTITIQIIAVGQLK